MQSMTRRRWWQVLAAGATGAAYAHYVEPRWLRVTTRDVRLPGLRTDRPLRLMHVSDLHASDTVPPEHIEHAIELAVRTRPDLICVTGDFVTRRDDFDPVRFEKALCRLGSAAPAYAVMGNHDGGTWSRLAGGYATTRELDAMAARSGMTVLTNRRLETTIAGQSVRLAGVGDLWAEEEDGAKAFQGLTKPDGLPTVLLAHNPDSKDNVGQYPWHLMLSGHTHGGQVVMPVFGLNHSPVKDKRFVAGLLPWQDRLIHISHGVGNVFGVRFNCRPEVTLLHLHG